MSENYSVVISEFAERHYIKSFKKKYHTAWDITLKTIIFQFERIDLFSKRDVAEIIISKEPFKIIKSNFSVAGTGMSPKSSGNRCIVLADEQKRLAIILLVYAKTDISQHNETAKWQGIIKENYPQYKNLFG
jgi:hypothetical protein